MSIYSFSSILKPARHLATAVFLSAGVAAFAAPPQPPVFAPEILITGMSTAINDGTIQQLKLNGTYFGQAEIGVNSWEHSFEIRNFGNADLIVTTPLTLTGPNTGDFVFTQQPANVIPAGQRSQFKIRFTPSFVGNAYAQVVIDNNDSDESQYTFDIRGDGVDQPLVGPDLQGDLAFYKKYNCRGLPLLFCKMNGKVLISNLSTDYDLSLATVRVYVVDGDVMFQDPYLLDEIVVKNLKAYQPGKKLKVKKVKFKGVVPPGYTHIFAEVVPRDGSEDINYTNNRAEHLYGI